MYKYIEKDMIWHNSTSIGDDSLIKVKSNGLGSRLDHWCLKCRWVITDNQLYVRKKIILTFPNSMEIFVTGIERS
jgi:hypothetical protein